MKITIELSSYSEREKVLSLLKALQLESVKVISDPASPPPIQNGDKAVDGGMLFGIWKENPRTLADIRNNSWKRAWNV